MNVCEIAIDKLFVSNVNVRKTLCNHYYCSDCIEPRLKELNKKNSANAEFKIH